MTIHLHDFDGEHSLTLDAGGLTADAVRDIIARAEDSGFEFDD
ncbi:hypothetical protein [Streptomyces armeniacus]|nr:hypothetical protein [Streptomyces armeniacus]